MLVGLSSIDYSLTASYLLNVNVAKSDLYTIGRRISREPTLSGGANALDFGHSVADVTFKLVLNKIDRETFLQLQDDIRLNSEWTLALDSGVYKVLPLLCSLLNGTVTLQLLAVDYA